MNGIANVVLAIALLAPGSQAISDYSAGEHGIENPDLPGLIVPNSHELPGSLVSDVIDIDSSVAGGADYLRRMQADITEDNAGNGTNGIDEYPDDPDDGGWDWVITSPPAPFSHSTGPSPTNIYGVTALGIYHAYLKSAEPALFVSLQDAADAIVAGGTGNIRTASDIIFLLNFNDLPEISGSAYRDAARAKYDARISQYGGAQSWAEYIRDARNGQGYGCGIIAWDIGAYVVAAAMLEGHFPGNGYGSDAVFMAEVIYQDSFNDNPGYFDIMDDQGWDPNYSNTNYFWYTLGITGIIDAFVAADVHSSEISGLLAILNECRYVSGAYSFSYGANEFDEDWQSTAYSVVSLARYDQIAYQNHVDISAFWIASTQDESGGFLYIDGSHYPEVAGECVSAMSFGNDPSEVWVDDDYCDVCVNDGHVWGYDAFDLIQDGVDVVGVDMVHVGPGIYEEQVVVESGLVLEGAGRDITIIQSPPSLAEYFTTSADNFPIVFIRYTDNVLIEGMTVNGLGRGNSNYRFVGIGIWNAGASVSDVRVTGVRDTPFSGAQHGVSIFAYNNTGGPYSIDISDVEIDDMQKSGMVLGGAGLTVDVSGCTITGQGPTTVTAQNGIQISDGASGSIVDNEISAIYYSGTDWSASGLLAYFPAGGLNVSQNNLHDCQGALNAYFADDLVLSGNSFTGNDFEFIWGGDGGSVGGNVFNNNAEALYIADAANMAVEQNNFAGNDLGIIIDGVAASIQLSANRIINSTTAAVIVQPYLTDEPDDIIVNGNCIQGNSFGIGNSTSNMVNAEGNWFGDPTGPSYGTVPLNNLSAERPRSAQLDENSPPAPGKKVDHKKYTTSRSKYDGLIALEGTGDPVSETVDYSPWWGADYLGDSHSNPWTWCVDNSNNSTIQEAVDCALPGDMIMVTAGTYEEQVVVAKSDLTIAGAGADSDPAENSIVIAPDDMPYYFTTSADNYPIIGIDGATGVNLENIRIDGAGRGNTNYRFVGIGLWNAGGAISGCHIANIQDTPFSGAQHGVGIYSYNNDGGPYDIQLSGVTVDTFQKTGIALGGSGLNVDIQDCNVTGAGPTVITAQNGIQVGFGAGGNLTDCNVSDVAYIGESWAATGILLYNGTSVAISGCSVSNCQCGVIYQETQGSVQEATISPAPVDNTEGISIRDYGLNLGRGSEIKFLPASVVEETYSPKEGAILTSPTSVDVTNSVLTGVGLVNSYGIAGWSLGEDVNATITGTSISGWEIGIVSYEDQSMASVPANGNAVFENEMGYWSNTASIQDARGNWWGDITGPYNAASNPDADGNEVGDGVDYSPWWSIDYVGDDHTGSWHWLVNISNSSTIQEAIDTAADGDSITATAAIYTGSSSIDKPLTLMGVPAARVEVGDHNAVGLDISSDDVTVDGMRFCECRIGIAIYLDQSEYSVSPGYSNIRLLNNTIWNTYGDRGFGIYAGTESERFNPADPLGIYDPSLTGLLDFSGLQIIGNSIFHTQQAALVLQSIKAYSGVIDVSENEIFEVPSFSAIWIDASQEIDVRNNELRDCGYGAFFSDYADGYYEGSPNDTYDPKNISFSDNTITLNHYGFAVYDGWLSALEFYHNTITGNTNLGFYNFLPFTVDATLNYWGSLDGPTHASNPAGDGDAVSDYVDYDPWCNEDFTICDFHVGANCDYILGDWNGSGSMNVADVVEAFSNLKTGAPEPAYTCECPAGSGNEWAVAMDVNNTCTFNVADVIAAYSRLKTGLPDLFPCEDCTPAGWLSPGDDEAPLGAPVQKNKIISIRETGD